MTPASDMAPAPFDPQRPFRRRTALAAGVAAKRLRGPEFRQLTWGVYVDAALPVTPRLLAQATVVPFDATAFASHASAARIHGTPIPVLPDEHVTVLEPTHRRRRRGTVCHLRTTAVITVVDGTRVSSYRQMLVELAELLSLVDLVVVGDWLVRRKGVEPEQLRAFCADSTLPGAALAREAASYVRERVDSPMETRLRMLLVLAGLPEPAVNPTLRAHDGAPRRRYDLHYPASNTIVEYDGRQHAEREEQWESDLERREAIDDDHARLLVVTAKGIYQHPERTVDKVWRTLRERGEPNVPARLSDAWRRHFPGRGE